MGCLVLCPAAVIFSAMRITGVAQFHNIGKSSFCVWQLQLRLHEPRVISSLVLIIRQWQLLAVELTAVRKQARNLSKRHCDIFSLQATIASH
jgi:hypothetical protein